MVGGKLVPLLPHHTSFCKLIVLFSQLYLVFRFLGILKFTLLCDIFTKHKSDLSREERQEIIQHSRKR